VFFSLERLQHGKAAIKGGLSHCINCVELASLLHDFFFRGLSGDLFRGFHLRVLMRDEQ
jgi:hypothetical protein